MCIQETTWNGSTAKEIEETKCSTGVERQNVLRGGETKCSTKVEIQSVRRGWRDKP